MKDSNNSSFNSEVTQIHNIYLNQSCIAVDNKSTKWAGAKGWAGVQLPGNKKGTGQPPWARLTNPYTCRSQTPTLFPYIGQQPNTIVKDVVIKSLQNHVLRWIHFDSTRLGAYGHDLQPWVKRQGAGLVGEAMLHRLREGHKDTETERQRDHSMP